MKCKIGLDIKQSCKANLINVAILCRATNTALKYVCKVFEPRCEKTRFCICENKDADQLRGNREADQRLCFHYMDTTIPLLPKYKISSL